MRIRRKRAGRALTSTRIFAPTPVALFIACLVLVALAGACSGDDASPIPSPSTTGTVAPSPSPIPPTSTPTLAPTATPALIPRLWVELGVCIQAPDDVRLPDLEGTFESALIALYPSVAPDVVRDMTGLGCPGGYRPPPADIAKRPVIGPGTVDRLGGLRFLVFITSDADANRVLRPAGLEFGLAEWELLCASPDDCAIGSTAVFLDPAVVAESAELVSVLREALSEK